MSAPLAKDQLNLQPHKTSKIYGIIKMGATKSDVNAIKALQQQSYNEHEIQKALGVHFTVIRSFMAYNAKKEGWDYKDSDAPVTPETQHLHDRIKELEEGNDDVALARIAELKKELASSQEVNAELRDELGVATKGADDGDVSTEAGQVEGTAKTEVDENF